VKVNQVTVMAMAMTMTRMAGLALWKEAVIETAPEDPMEVALL